MQNMISGDQDVQGEETEYTRELTQILWLYICYRLSQPKVHHLTSFSWKADVFLSLLHPAELAKCGVCVCLIWPSSLFTIPAYLREVGQVSFTT